MPAKRPIKVKISKRKTEPLRISKINIGSVEFRVTERKLNLINVCAKSTERLVNGIFKMQNNRFRNLL